MKMPRRSYQVALCRASRLVFVSVLLGGVGWLSTDQLSGNSISGTVTDVDGGLPLEDVTVQIRDSSGSFVTSGTTDASGSYTSFDSLDDGTYFARTFNGSGYVNELFDDIPCDICDVTLGTPIVISGAIPVTDIDFPLDLGGSVSGKVTDAASGDPLARVSVIIMDADGSFGTGGFSDADGNYTSFSPGLPTGSYFANTRNAPGYFDELYNNLPLQLRRLRPRHRHEFLGQPWRRDYGH